MSGLSTTQMHICDARNEKLVEELADYDVLILAGGHVPTQNKFFERIRLKEHINHFDGILIGISAGTMNSAEIVYAQPELEGESIDKEDGSYFMIENKTTTLFGTAYLIKDGNIKQICEKDRSICMD